MAISHSMTTCKKMQDLYTTSYGPDLLSSQDIQSLKPSMVESVLLCFLL